MSVQGLAGEGDVLLKKPRVPLVLNQPSHGAGMDQVTLRDNPVSVMMHQPGTKISQSEGCFFFFSLCLFSFSISPTMAEYTLLSCQKRHSHSTG